MTLVLGRRVVERSREFFLSVVPALCAPILAQLPEAVMPKQSSVETPIQRGPSPTAAAESCQYSGGC